MASTPMARARAAKLYAPEPANLQPSRQPVQRYVQRNDRPWRREAHGALVIHAAWGEELTDEQIRDVIAYLKSILTVSPPAQSTRQ